RERELARGQVDLGAADRQPPRAQVEREVVVGEDVDLRAGGGVLPQPQPHPGQQLLEAERLGDVVVGAALEPGDGVGDRVAGREDDDRGRDAQAADGAQHLEAVDVRQPEVEDQQVELAAGGEVDTLPAGADVVRGVAGRPQPLRDEGRDPLLVLDDQDLAHGTSWGSSGRGPSSGSTIVNVLPMPGRESSSTVPPCACAIERTIVRPSPEPSAPLRSARTKRSKTRSWSAGSMPMPSSRTQSRTTPSPAAEPSATVEPSAENLTALLASCSQACVTRRASRVVSTSARPSSVQRRSPSGRALVSTSSVSTATSVGCGVTKSGRRALASVTSSSTSEFMRSSSSSATAREAAASSGSAGSMSSRWPRTTVSGVRSSWPTSSSSCRCEAKALSRRSSIPLTVVVSSARSSLPTTSMRCDRSS